MSRMYARYSVRCSDALDHDCCSLIQDYLDVQQQLAFYTSSRAALQTEVETISVALNGMIYCLSLVI